jgi:hypothetical protein
MTGFAVIAPKPVTLAWRRNRHRTASRGMVRVSSDVEVVDR